MLPFFNFNATSKDITNLESVNRFEKDDDSKISFNLILKKPFKIYIQ